MRKDINKALTERPRRGHKSKHKEIRKKFNSSFDVNYVDEDDGPLGGQLGMRQPYRGWDIRKQPSDLYGVIRRFMASRVGRLWDDVWSEVNRDLKESDDMRAHWRVHCKIEVDEKISVAPNGRLWRLGGRRSWVYENFDWNDSHPAEIPGLFKNFYVDPRDGILKKAPEKPSDWVRPRWRDRKPDQPEHGYVMDDGISIKAIDGIWYQMSYTPHVESVRVPVYDYGSKVRPAPLLRYEYHLQTNYDFTKRQLNTKELVRYGVRNDP